MLTIRLRRTGKKNQPFFRMVVIDKKRSATGGRAVEIVGNIDPLTKKKVFKKERILYWISKGAKPTATIHNLLVSEKIIDAKKIAKKSKKPAVTATPATPAAAPAQAQIEVKKEEVKPPEEAKPVVVEKPAPASAEASASAETMAGQAGEAKEEPKPEEPKA